MKRFLNIRNMLVLLIIIIAAGYIVWGRSNDTKHSKTYQLFNSFNNYGAEYNNHENTTLKLDYTDEKKEIKIIYATDNENRREIRSFDVNDKETKEHGQTVSVTTKEGVQDYILEHTEKTYVMFDLLKDSGSEFFANWAHTFTDLITKNQYYTRGYEFVNGELMYYEYFKDSNSKLYFNSNNELVYMNSESLDKSFREFNNSNIRKTDLYLFKVTISHDRFDNTLIEIPQEYKIRNVNENQ